MYRWQCTVIRNKNPEGREERLRPCGTLWIGTLKDNLCPGCGSVNAPESAHLTEHE